ncbi:hypothetical protein HYZ41_01080 [archaeon]|nr:hypothetical protein [archaeon]
MNYRDQVKSYVSQMQRDFGQYVPKDFPLQFFDSNVTNETLYSMAMNLYTMVKTAKDNQKPVHSEPDPGKKMFYLVPHTEKDGSVYYMDRFTSKVVMSMVRQPNGLFSYYGPREMMTMFGGRGELGQMLKNVEDEDFFHDKPSGKR